MEYYEAVVFQSGGLSPFELWNKMEQEEFEIWVDNNLDVIKLVEEKLEHNAIYKHILSKANHDGASCIIQI